MDGKGSCAKVRSEAPFSISPFARPQLETRKVLVSFVLSIVVGNGGEVLVVRESCAAKADAGIDCC